MMALAQPRRRTSAPELIALADSDIAEVAKFIAEQSGKNPEFVETHLRWFLLENPARRADDALGFGLRFEGRLVGCILCVPQTFRFNDRTIDLMGSSSFYVDEDFRGQGGRIFLQYCRLGSRMPAFGTSANPEAAGLWKAAGAKPLLGSQGELLAVLRWPPLAEEFARRKYCNSIVTRIAGSSLSNLAALFRPLKIDVHKSIALRPLSSAEEVSSLGAHRSSSKLTANRDISYIQWRYFSNRDKTAAFAFRSPLFGEEDILVTVNQRQRGYRGQIKALNLLDVYPEAPPQVWLEIIGALAHQYQSVVDMIVLRHQKPEHREFLCRRGLLWRAFEAPTGWLLDKSNLLPTEEVYFVPADGDGLI